MTSYIERIYKSLFVIKQFVATELTTIRVIGNNHTYSLSIINDGPKLIHDYDMKLIYEIV